MFVAQESRKLKIKAIEDQRRLKAEIKKKNFLDSDSEDKGNSNKETNRTAELSLERLANDHKRKY